VPDYVKKPLGFLGASWRIWAPPVILAIILFVAAVLLSHGGTGVSFIYRLF